MEKLAECHGRSRVYLGFWREIYVELMTVNCFKSEQFTLIFGGQNLKVVFSDWRMVKGSVDNLMVYHEVLKEEGYRTRLTLTHGTKGAPLLVRISF